MKHRLNRMKSLGELQIEAYIELQELKHSTRQVAKRVSARVVNHLKDEKGIGTLELIFITVIVLGMAVLFRNQISEIFKKVYEALQKLNQNMNTDPLTQQST